MPEACSALISTEADFDKICNFLFFCASSCIDQTEYELLTQALFELLKNYEYKWKLRLQHIFTALENLGMNGELLMDNDKVLSDALQNRSDLVKRMNAVIGRKDKKVWPPKCMAFVESRRKRGVDASEVSTTNLWFWSGGAAVPVWLIFTCGAKGHVWNWLFIMLMQTQTREE